ncbi:flagellar protein FlaG [Kordiimonas gwangyangensis]|uniref:flagellar protein FlaG n=1 Tax=Kordiimonas gwangyangensis TaxID=288022 RepID=UPI000379E7C1|nr:flagellar protein FlaG [Kordiimonas gwangyangensis]
MTEIGNTSGVAQVVDLRSNRTSSSGSAGIDRFSSSVQTEKSGSEPALVKSVETLGGEDVPVNSPLDKAAKALEKFIPEDQALPNTRLRIDRDDETGRFVYLNIDNESGEVIKQFPPESILEFLSYYREVAGLTVDDKA